ncbi:MAG: hypothetical protein ACOY0T_21250 [Myxococcota bacterium]
MFKPSFLVGLGLCLLGVACGSSETGGSRQEPSSRATRALTSAPAATTNADCSLLDNPATRSKLGGALENKLLIACGRAQRSAQGAPPVRSTPSAARALAAAPGSDIPVSNPSLDVGGSTQSETSAASAGNVVCVAWNDAGEGFGANGFAGFGYSLDGGQTFTDGGPFPAGPGNDQSFGDPSLAYSARDNAFYFASLSSRGLSLWRSNDSCQSFQYVGAIHSSGGDDKELMAVDNTPTSPFYGRIYVGWTAFGNPGDINVAAHSDDGGATWSAPAAFPGSGTSGQGVYPAVAPNGDVYMALVNRAFTVGGHQDQWLYKSTNGGDSWTQVSDIGTDQLQPENGESTVSCGRQALTGDIRNLSSPQIAISADSAAPAGYVIHAVYPYDSDGSGADHSNVFYRRSTDAGATWSPEFKLNDDTTNTDQFYPNIGVGESGILAASWYDRRLDPTGNLLFDRYLTISTDGGFSWTPNERLSDVSSPVAQTNPNFDGLATCYHGDYDQIVVNGNLAHVIWSDDRRVTASGPNPDIYYDQWVVNPRAGRLRAQQPTIGCSGSVTFLLSDSDLAGTGTHSISVTTSNGDSESLLMTEDSSKPGSFSASINTSSGAATPNDGVLQVSDAVTITGTYEDADDGTGKSASVSALLRADCAPPLVTNARISGLSGDAATISVDANEATALTVDYGFSCDSLNQSVTSKLSPSPSATLTQLYPGVLYYYALTAMDAVGNSARDDNGGSCYSFKTLDIVSNEGFEAGLGGYVIDNGDQGGGFGGDSGSGGAFGSGGAGVAGSMGFGGKPSEAAIEAGAGGAFAEGGAPSGGSGGGGGVGGTAVNGLWHRSDTCASALVGHSATHTLHYGNPTTCTYNGMRSEGFVTSPIISLTDASFASIEFEYFLGTEGGGFYDQASVEISVNGGPFQVVSGNFTQLIQPDPDEPPEHRTRPDARPAGRFALVENSGAWQHASQDISHLLVGLSQAQIQLRFHFNTVDGVLNDFAGFYVDDVRVLGAIAPVPCGSAADCDDSLFCTGTETCQNGFCSKGIPFVCSGDDGVPCTDAVCDEAAQGCVHKANDAKCDDGVFCNGFERCSVTSGCQPATPMVCPGGSVSCMVGSCREDLKSCVQVIDHNVCNDGLFCTGQEFCDPSVGCVSTGSPCVDNVTCTDDVCDESTFSCFFPPNNGRCDDGLFCTGQEYCDGFQGCRTTGTPCSGAEKCDETGNQCIPICFTDTNTNHQTAGRAYTKKNSYFALGSNDSLGSATAVTALQGSGNYWRHVPSCPAPPNVDSVNISVAGSVATVTGTASDPNSDIVKVRLTFFISFSTEVTLDATGTGSWKLSLGLPVGWHAVSAQAIDRAGFVSAPNGPYYFEVKQAQPPVIDTTTVSVNGNSVTVAGTASDPNDDIQKVEVTILQEGTVVAAVVATGTTSFSGTISGLAAGAYAARAQAFDSAGFVSTFGAPIPFDITAVSTCVTDTNLHHRAAGRAIVTRGKYYAVGSNDLLGKNGEAVTSLSGSIGYWRRVPQCP